MKKIYIPKEAVKYILFQRTAYLKIPNTQLYRKLKNRNLLPTSAYNKIVKFESFFFNGRIKKAYVNDMEKEFDSIKKYLPHSCGNILDIGCGIAGIDLFLNAHYKNKSVSFYLLDKNEVEGSVYYDFNSKAAFYNSLDLASYVLEKNNVSKDNIKLLFANDENEINVDKKFDFVISLISWGFHYPISIYLDRVYDVLNFDGVLIVDIRKGNDGMDLIREAFSKVDVILDEKKYFRVRAVK